MKFGICLALGGLISVSALAQDAAPAGVLAPAPVALSPAEPSAQAAGHAGILKSVRGPVQVLSANGATRLARPGDRVSQSDQIIADAHSAASLVLRDGTALVVGPSSRLELKQFAFDSTTQEGRVLVSLLRGSLRMVSGLIGQTRPEAVRVDTPTATIGIRGTDFIVIADGAPRE